MGGFLVLGLLAFLLPFLMLSDLVHSVEDIKAGISLIRSGDKPVDFEELSARKIPAKKGDLRFHIPNILKAPFEL